MRYYYAIAILQLLEFNNVGLPLLPKTDIAILQADD